MKVLVGVPTYDGHAFCRVELLRFLEAINKEPWVDVLVVWNGKGDPWGFEDYEIVTIKNPQPKRKKDVENAHTLHQDILVRKNNYLRERVLQGDYTHLFLLESDVIPPVSAVKRLLSWNKAVITALYFVKATQDVCTKVSENEYIKQRLELGGIQDADTLFYVRDAVVPAVWSYQRTSVGSTHAPLLGHRIMTIEEWIDIRLNETKLYPIASSGIGCMLIEKRVLEKVRFMGGSEYFKQKPVRAEHLCDYIFCENIKKAGFQLFLDHEIICQHHTVAGYVDAKIADEISQKFEFEE